MVGNKRTVVKIISCQPLPNRNHLDFVSILFYGFIFVVGDYEYIMVSNLHPRFSPEKQYSLLSINATSIAYDLLVQINDIFPTDCIVSHP